LNPWQLICLKAFFLGLAGVPFAYLFDRNGYFFYMTRNVTTEYILQAYLWTVYGFLVIFLSYYFLGLNKRLIYYQSLDLEPMLKNNYIVLWAFSFVGILTCIVVLLIQVGTHPIFLSLNLDPTNYAIKRIEVASKFNANIYNLGLKVFGVFALITSLFVIKKFLFSFITIISVVVLATFSLAKSPMADTLLMITFIYLLMYRPKWLQMIPLMFLMVLAIGAMYFLSGGLNNISNFLGALSNRVLYGQFADLPYYFLMFQDECVTLSSILPPYIQSLFGDYSINAARMVIELTDPQAFLMGAAGVANTVFIGEAYAWAGILGVLIAPFWVAFHFLILIIFFTCLKKTIYNVFFFGYLLCRLSDGLFGGFSYYIFSGIHIVWGGFIYLLLLKFFIDGIGGSKKLKEIEDRP